VQASLRVASADDDVRRARAEAAALRAEIAIIRASEERTSREVLLGDV
jgi:hypothetical protein